MRGTQVFRVRRALRKRKALSTQTAQQKAKRKQKKEAKRTKTQPAHLHAIIVRAGNKLKIKTP
jgi:hypothetical protein